MRWRTHGAISTAQKPETTEAARARIFGAPELNTQPEAGEGEQFPGTPSRPSPLNPAHWVRPVPPGYSPDSLPT